MNREIKFRGRKVDNNEWVFGQLVFKKCLRDNGGVEHMLREWEEEFAFIYEDNLENNCEEYPTKFIEIDIKTIGQYTGLKDKNGVEVYEGDKVNIQYQETIVENAIIEYKGASFYGATDYDCWELDEYLDIEVVGNIYENEVD